MSYEITRKDRLYKNFQRMQHAKGARHFDFLPQTFCTPSEFDDLVAAHNKERGTWIVKPVASSRGRGIFLVNSPQNVPLDAAYVVCRYLNNPLLIDGFKFDLRLYVAVTSYDPLRIYLYEEGLTRFATVQYQTNNKTIKNTCMHLTNYSVNKKSRDYVKCDDGDVEDYGNKWSLGAMFRYLKKQGKDIKLLLTRIEEVVNKTIICAELPVATACKMFQPNRGNCFELYGFDILVDANLKPWVLEVNLSPSLACDAPIDMKIKSNVCGDLFSLTGFVVQDPVMRRMQQSRRNQDLASSSTLRQQKERIGSAFSRQRPNSAGAGGSKLNRPSSGRKSAASATKDSSGLTLEERKVVLESKEEYSRRGGWMRTFPSPNSMDKYGSLMENRNSYNQMLHSRLFSDKKVSHALVHELQERDLEEHLGQLLRKLATKDNSVDRRNLRNKVRNKFPATKKIAMAPSSTLSFTRSASQADASKRGPLAQGKLDTNSQGGLTKNSQQQQQDPAQQSKSNGTTASHQQPQQKGVDSSGGKGNTQNNTKGGNMQNGGGQQGGGGTNATSNGVQGKPPPGPGQGSGGDKADGNHGSRMVLDVQKPKGPTKDEIRELVNVPEIVDKGGDLSKLQARNAFATYLLRVQQRLIAETTKPADKLDQVDQHDEQMDLVLRFLKRAASNLQQQFKVIVPSRKLPIHDRRRILAKQLVDFVQIYSKETEEMEEKKPKRVVKPHNHHQFEEDHVNINDNRFNHFVNVANEGELEELLTTYTKQNKSASIFLGTSTPQPKSLSEMMAQPTSVNNGTSHDQNHHHHHQQHQQHQQQHQNHQQHQHGQQQHHHGKQIPSSGGGGGGALLHRRTGSVENLHSSSAKAGGSGDTGKEITYSTVPAGTHSNKALSHYYAAAGTGSAVAVGDKNHPTTSSAAASSIPKRPHSTTNAGETRYGSSADGAVQVYSAKFSRQRPFSAKAGHTLDAGEGRYPSSGRPTSAVVYRDSSGGQIAARHFSESSQQAIQEALQRLAKRQAARQYSASSNRNQNLLTQKYVEQHFGLVNPFQGQATHAAPGVQGYGSNAVLTSTLGRSGSRSRSSSVGHVRSASSQAAASAVGETPTGGNVKKNNSRMNSAVVSEKERVKEPVGHARRSSHSGVALNRTQSLTTDTSSRDGSDMSGPAIAAKSTGSHGSAGEVNGWADDAYSAQLKAMQHLTVSSSNRTPVTNNHNHNLQSQQQQQQQQQQHQQEGRSASSLGGSRQVGSVVAAARPMSLQEQQQMAYELSQQSKAKHQEKIAQAHTNASAIRDAIRRNAAASVSASTSSSPSHRPRPPPQSANARKPISTQRLARTAQVEDGSKSSTAYYTNLKYNNASEVGHHHNNSGLIQTQVIRH